MIINPVNRKQLIIRTSVFTALALFTMLTFTGCSAPKMEMKGFARACQDGDEAKVMSYFSPRMLTMLEKVKAIEQQAISMNLMSASEALSLSAVLNPTDEEIASINRCRTSHEGERVRMWDPGFEEEYWLMIKVDGKWKIDDIVTDGKSVYDEVNQMLEELERLGYKF